MAESAILPASSVTGGLPAFLGVDRSIGGRRWVGRATDERAGMALAQRLGLPEVVGRVLAARGVGMDDAEAFLSPSLRASLPDPSSFLDMDKAATRIADAVEKGERIAIFGDYDVDGATSGALLGRFLRAVGGDVLHYVPDRQKEGYGPNTPALLTLRGQGASLAITVDCGATAHEPIAAAQAAGLDIVVCDHHMGEPVAPPAVAVVNPNRFDETTPHRQLAAVGVAFLMAVAVNRELRRRGWYGDQRREPDLMGSLDLVALGTVADVVPLTGLNRALVAQGIKVLVRRGNVGIAALADVAGLNEQPDAYHLGYVLGPRVNAGGRVGNAGYGTTLLGTDDADEARWIAGELHRLNEERRQIEAQVLAQAEAKVESLVAVRQASRANSTASLVMVSDAGWHAGVIGIVASRLKDRYNLPALVLAIEDGVAKGSGRSVPGIDLGSVVLAARQAGLLINGGGHAMAAGLTVAEDRLEELSAFLEERIAQHLEAVDITPTLGLDGALDCLGATGNLIGDLARLGPFGQGNSEPRFVIRDARVVKADVVGANHVRAILTGPSGGRLKSIAFRCLETPLGEALMQSRGLALHIAGHLRPDSWAGEGKVQLVIDDAAWA